MPRTPITIQYPESGVSLVTVGSQITEATAPSVGTNTCYVLADGGSDEGVYCHFHVPEDYSSGPEIVIRGILDGGPSASHTLGFGYREHIAADNETADGTFATAQLASATIGSNGSSHANEDACEEVITATATYAAGDDVWCYIFIDASATSYTGNFLLTGLYFEYTAS